MCCLECAQNHARIVSGKRKAVEQAQERKATKERLETLKSKAQIAKAAQDAVNAYIRARDAGQPCISCGTLTAEVYQAGHFLSVGARPELRFEFDNIHAQCVQCNMHKAGNVAAYRVRLIQKIGEKRVLELEGPHPMPKWSRDDLLEIKRNAQKMSRELKAASR